MNITAQAGNVVLSTAGAVKAMQHGRAYTAANRDQGCCVNEPIPQRASRRRLIRGSLSGHSPSRNTTVNALLQRMR